nr:ribonuclease H-like domain-containing protein [Thioalkalivibrio sp. ALJ24]
MGAAPKAPGPSASARAATLDAESAPAPVGATERSPAPATCVASAAELAEHLGGTRIGEHVILLDRELPVDTVHGRLPLGRAAGSAWPFWPAGERVGFIDTETTGLAGGAGTVAFLVGLATPSGEGLRLRQWLMTAFAGEAAMLAAVDEALGECRHLVSYNGKTFDLPLLRDRRRMQRRHDPAETAHTDFLHPVRGLFGHAWPDCRLRTTEERLLGLQRRDDLPGSEAPWAWQAYLRFGQADLLQRVVRHNADDILSLAVLGPALAEVLADPPTHAASPEGAARLLDRLGGPGEARHLLQQCEPHLGLQGRLWLARERRRAGEWPRAVALWQPLAEQGHPEAIEALAKYHEHQRRDPATALHWARRLPDTPATRTRRARLERLLSSGSGVPKN